MAFDKSEPRTGMITALALGIVVSLIALRAVLQSYFTYMTEDELARKILETPPTEVRQLRAEEATRLESGPMPIEQAMATLARGERPAAVSPQPSNDLAPMSGWTQMPRHFTPPGVTPPPAPPSPAPAATAQGTVGGPTVTPSEAAAGSAFAPPGNPDGGLPGPTPATTIGPPRTTGTEHPGPGHEVPPAGASPVPQNPPATGPVPQHAPAGVGSPRPNAGARVPGAVAPAPSGSQGGTTTQQTGTTGAAP